MPILKTVCPHDCPDACSILATVEEGRVTKCEGDPDHPFTRGFLCHKVAAYDQRIYSPERVLHPMMRALKGGPLQRTTWEEAAARIVARMGRGESILPFSYGGNLGMLARTAGHAFFHALGALQLKRTICDDAAMAGWNAVVGAAIGTDIEHLPSCDLIVIWGMNLAVVNLHAMPFLREAQKNGARVVVVDPYRTETAQHADVHLMPRPGTDAALALGIMRALLDGDQVDREFIASHTRGFKTLEKLLQDYPVERCEAICRVSDLRGIARLMADARAPFFRLGIGFSRHANGAQAVASVTGLAALLGAFRAGGALLETFDAFELDADVLQRPDLMPHPTREINMVQLGDALTRDDAIRSIFIYQSNPAAVCPEQKKVRRGLAREDLFVVVHEQMMTDTVQYADVVLPATTSFESADLFRSYGHYYMQRARPVIAPLGEAKSNVAMFNFLAQAYGLDDPIFSADEETRIAMLLETRHGRAGDIDIRALERGEPVRMSIARNPFENGFPTPDGRLRLDAVTGYRPCPEGCDAADGRLQLLVPPAKHFLNTTFGSVASLVRRQKRQSALIHPQEAAGRSIQDGAAVRLFNDRGEVMAHAVVTEDVPPGVLVVPGVWWGKDTPDGANANVLTSARLSDAGDASTFHCALVDISPAHSGTIPDGGIRDQD
ncbi:MAG: molybdopterin-containing oxidoreductase family protein [Candidatus Xenobia bacterium]